MRTHLIGSGLGTSDPARRRPDPAPVAGGGEGRDEVCGREEVGGGGEETETHMSPPLKRTRAI